MSIDKDIDNILGEDDFNSIISEMVELRPKIDKMTVIIQEKDEEDTYGDIRIMCLDGTDRADAYFILGNAMRALEYSETHWDNEEE